MAANGFGLNYSLSEILSRDQRTVQGTGSKFNYLISLICLFSDEEIKEMSWTTFVSGCVEPELIEYLKERRIYINEPVDSEEDI